MAEPEKKKNLDKNALQKGQQGPCDSLDLRKNEFKNTNNKKRK